MQQDKVHETPSQVSAEEGTVLVDGPDGVAVALTPEAAEKTSDRLLEGAVEARGQRLKPGSEDEKKALEEKLQKS